MKKTVLFLISALCISSYTVKAQNASDQSIRFGVRGGLNNTQLKGLAILNQKASTKLGVLGGAYLHIPVAQHVVLQPEVNFSNQRTHIDKNDGAAPLSQDVIQSYLNIPLVVKIYVGSVFNIHLGPQVGVLLAAKKKGEIGYNFSGSQTYIVEGTADVKKDYRSNAGVLLGLGADMKNGLVFGARMNYGLRDINNSDYERKVRDFYGLDKGIYVRNVELTVGYTLGTKQ